MSKSAKSNLGHKRRMTHRQKVRLMRKMKGKDEIIAAPWHSKRWQERLWRIRVRVNRNEVFAKRRAERRRFEKRQALATNPGGNQ